MAERKRRSAAAEESAAGEAPVRKSTAPDTPDKAAEGESASEVRAVGEGEPEARDAGEGAPEKATDGESVPEARDAGEKVPEAEKPVRKRRARRKEKPMREVLRGLMSLEVDDEKTAAALERAGLEPVYANALGLAVLRKAAVEGDLKAALFLREALEGGAGAEAPVRVLDLSAMSDGELEELARRGGRRG